MKSFLKVALAGAAMLSLASAAQAAGGACLITKNNTNPFFVKMKEGAEAAAKDAGKIGRASCRERVSPSV